MRKVWIAAAAASISIAAHAQLVGGAGGTVGAATSATTGAIGTSAGAHAGVDSSVGTTLDKSAVRDADGAARSTASMTRDAADASARAVHDGAATAKGASLVNAGAGVHVTRETRCYDGTSYYDPYYGDGYYYCETSGPGASVAVKAKPGG